MKNNITIHSYRFYQNELDLSLWSLLSDDVFDFTKIKYHAYNVLFDIKFNKLILPDNKSIFCYIRDKFNIDCYYANSIVNLAQGMLDSQLELIKLQKDDYQEKINSILDKIESYDSKINSLNNCLISLRKIQNNLKLKEPSKNLKLKTWKGSFISYDFNKNKDHIWLKDKYVGLYFFEYQYVYANLRKFKNIKSKLIYKLNNYQNKLNNLDKPKRICFGSKDFFKKFKKLSNFESLLYDRKYKQLDVSGRKDAKFGNFIFKYDNNSLLTFTSMKGIEIKISVVFPYLENELHELIENYKKPVAFGYKFKKDRLGRKYIVFYASFDRAITKRINTDISTGIVSMDFNVGHIDLSNIDSFGNLIDTKTIYYEITNNKNQNIINLRKAVKEVGEYVLKNKKILAMEDLDLKKLKEKSMYKNKSYNKMLHYFPYARINELLNSEACKREFDIINVNPAYTSLIGQFKYAESKKLNNHIAASYVIGRRALNIKDKVPKKYRALLNEKMKNKHSFKQWRSISNKLKKLEKEKLELRKQENLKLKTKK